MPRSIFSFYAFPNLETILQVINCIQLMVKQFRWTSTVDHEDTSQRKTKGCRVKSKLWAPIKLCFLWKISKLQQNDTRAFSQVRLYLWEQGWCLGAQKGKNHLWQKLIQRSIFLIKRFFHCLFLPGSHPSGEACRVRRLYLGRRPAWQHQVFFLPCLLLKTSGFLSSLSFIDNIRFSFVSFFYWQH